MNANEARQLTREALPQSLNRKRRYIHDSIHESAMTGKDYIECVLLADTIDTQLKNELIAEGFTITQNTGEYVALISWPV